MIDLENGFQIAPESYDAIVCFYYLHRPLIAQIRQGLKPGGVVVYETYLIDQAQWSKPKNPEHLLGHNELLDVFCGLRILRYREGIMGERKAIASLVAQRGQ